MFNLEKLEKLNSEWAACERCPLSKLRNRMVFGHGSPDARLVIIGEVPTEDNVNGEVGLTGEIMNELWNSVGIDSSDVWLTNVCLCRPAPSFSKKKRAPKLDEIRACYPRLVEELDIIRPEIIVLAGNTPLYVGTGRRGITKNRGWLDTFTMKCIFSGSKVYATLHPSSLLHGSEEQKEMKADWLKQDWLNIAEVFLGKKKREDRKVEAED